MIFERMQKPAPKWLLSARQTAAFQRPTGLTYINLQRLREVGPVAADPHRKPWIDLLGLAQSPWLVSASGLVGPDAVTRTVLPIGGQPRGLLFPANDRGLKREDLAAIPEDATLALAVRLNVQKTLDALAAAGEKADPEIKQPLLKGLEMIERGGDAGSRQDIFASLGDRWCFYNSPREGGLVLTGLTGVVPITDRKQFSRSYEVLARLVTQNLPADDGLSPNAQRIRRFRFAGSEVHYASMGDIGLAPAWWAGDKQLVVALAPQNIKAHLSRENASRSLADVPDVAAELAGRDPLLAVGYLDAPRLFEAVYPLLMIAAPSYLGASGLSEGRRDLAMIPSLPAIGRHLRPGVATLRRTGVGLELTSRGSLPGFGLAGPVMFLAWDSQWLNLVFGESENNAPPAPVVPAAAPAGLLPPPAAMPPALPPPAPAR
jgi:hypothetical protein